MAKIENYSVLNFSGGVVRNKSPFELQKNQLLDARNIEIFESGRLRVRRGAYQIGDTLTGNIESSFVFFRNVAGSTPTIVFIVANNASTGVLSRLRGTRLASAITTASTTVSVTDASQVAASGTVEIEGDLIAYSGKSSNDLTGVTGINSSHSAGAAVHQWATLTQPGTAINGTLGVYYAVINNLLIINGANGIWKQLDNDDGTTITEVTGEPNGIFITNFRDRCYVAGDNSSSGTNLDPRRVSFSARGDGTSWTSTDFFDVEDQRGEGVSGFRVLNDKLWIFKFNSIYSYDEIELKQRQSHVGAYSHKVIQEIDEIMYTFCPNGIFATNGFESTSIGDPVRQYWKNFHPIFDSRERTVTNVFAGKFEHRYLLYIYDITDPETVTDVCLEYDTIKKSWTVHQGGFTNFFHLNYIERFRFGDGGQQVRPALFGGDSSGKLYRFFESRYTDSTDAIRGTDVFQDLLSDTGSVVSGVIETPLYDLTHPQLYKQFKYLRGYVEQGQWTVSYRVENENGITDYKPLGVFYKTNQVLPFPKEAAGWRIGFKITAASTAHAPIFNGFVIEETEVIKRP